MAVRRKGGGLRLPLVGCRVLLLAFVSHDGARYVVSQLGRRTTPPASLRFAVLWIFAGPNPSAPHGLLIVKRPRGCPPPRASRHVEIGRPIGRSPLTIS